MQDPAKSARLPRRSSSDAAEQPTLASGIPDDFVPLRLALVPGGMAVEMTKVEVVLGRHSSSDVRLALPDVSRRHCRFIYVDASWHVIDLNSLNGTFVNGQRVQQITLKHGDRLRIGGFTFEVSLSNPPPVTVIPPPMTNQERRRAS